MQRPSRSPIRRIILASTATGLLVSGCSSDVELESDASPTTSSLTSESSPPTTSPRPTTTTPTTSSPVPTTAAPTTTAAPSCEVPRQTADDLLVQSNWDLGREAEQVNFAVNIDNISPAGEKQYLQIFSGNVGGTEITVNMDPSNGKVTVIRYGDQDLGLVIPGGSGVAGSPAFEERQTRDGRTGVVLEAPFDQQIGEYTFTIDQGSTQTYNGVEMTSFSFNYGRSDSASFINIGSVLVDQTAPGVALVTRTPETQMKDFSQSSTEPIGNWSVSVRGYSVQSTGVEGAPPDIRGAAGVEIVYGQNPSNGVVTNNPTLGVTLSAGSGVQRCNEGPVSIDNLQSRPVVIRQILDFGIG